MSHTINDLREHLFATLEGLRNKETPMEIDRAKAVAEVAQTIINSAKVEVDHMRVAGHSAGTGFIGIEQKPEDSGQKGQGQQPGSVQVLQDNAKGKTTVEHRAGMTITRHTAR